MASAQTLMAVVKTNYIKRDGREKTRAKATIRYIQHRPGRGSSSAAATGSHSTHCCELAELSNPEQLRYVHTYHDLDCEIYTSEYWLPYYTGSGWPSHSKAGNKAVQKDKLANNPTIPGDSKVGTTPMKENGRQNRALFGRDGAMGRQEAYRMIDEAAKGSVFFRFVISPDSKTEDTNRDLHLRDMAAQTMLELEEQMKQPVQWVAAEHADHSPHRHVHIVAVVPGRLRREDFQALPRVLRSAATAACLEQRQELDAGLAYQARGEREEAVWVQSL